MPQQPALSSINPDESEDVRQRLTQHLAETNQWVALLQADLAHARAQNIEGANPISTNDELAQRIREVEALRKELGEHKRERERLRTALVAVTEGKIALDEQLAQLQPLAERVSFTESRLSQREEEIHQTLSELKQQQHLTDELQSEVVKLRELLADADMWVFRLAGERRELELEIAISQRNLIKAEKLLTAERATTIRTEDKLAHRDRTLLEKNEEIARLDKTLDDLQAQSRALSKRAAAEPEVDYGAELHKSGLEARRLADERGLAGHARSIAEQEVKRLSAETTMLTQMLLELNDRAQIELNDQAQKFDAERTNYYFAETMQVASLSAKLQDSDERREREAILRERLSALSAALMRQPSFWWSLMPSRWRAKRRYAELRRRGIFDADMYFEMYPDVALAGMDPLDHYIRHGIDEGRIYPV
jgi:hypothetical protein